MAVCEISGKGKMYGHNVSFSQRKTRKVFKPNIQKKTLIIYGRKVKVNAAPHFEEKRSHQVRKITYSTHKT